MLSKCEIRGFLGIKYQEGFKSRTFVEPFDCATPRSGKRKGRSANGLTSQS